MQGSGCQIADADGRRYLDADGAAGSLVLGYGCGEVVDALADQMLALEHFTTGGAISTPPAVELAERLVRVSPPGTAKVGFLSGASEACDEAARLVREYHHRQGSRDRHWILSVTGGHYGRTLAGAALSGAGDDLGVGRPLAGFAQIPPPNPQETDGIDASLSALRSEVEHIGAQRIAALFVEPVLTGTSTTVLPKRWWDGVREILAGTEILLVLNESSTGIGRTGKWFAADHFGITPDLLILADAITGGYLPFAAILYGTTCAQVLAGADGGGSYGGHTASCAAGRAAIDVIERDGLIENAARLGEFILTALRGLTSLPVVHTVCGLGLIIGIELTGVDAAYVADVLREEHSLLVGVSGNGIRLTPPLVLTEADAGQIVAAVTSVLGHAAAQLPGVPA